MQATANGVTLKNRFTLLAFAVIAISVFALMNQYGGGSGFMVKVAIILAALLSAVIWWVMFQRSSDYFDAMADAESDARRRDAARLEAELRRLGQEQAADHVHQLSGKMDDFGEVLKMKFGENEMTYQRYLGVGHQLYAGANNNLQSVLASARSVSSMDPAKLESQLNALQRSGRGDSPEAEAIRGRYSNYLDQRKQIGRLIEQNEQALTALSDATTQLAGIDTNADSSPRMDSMIEDMRRLAERVDQYGVRV